MQNRDLWVVENDVAVLGVNDEALVDKDVELDTTDATIDIIHNNVNVLLRDIDGTIKLVYEINED